MAVTQIRSFKAFRTWLRDHGQHGNWFGRVGFDERSLIVSSESVWQLEWDKFMPDPLTLYPLQLPPMTPSMAAKAWWHDIFEQRITEFFCNKKAAIYCMVRLGVWKALPDWFVLQSKAEWQRIKIEAFRREVGPQRWSEMFDEYLALGVSIRFVYPSVTTKRKLR